jgi:hypothetical protein
MLVHGGTECHRIATRFPLLTTDSRIRTSMLCATTYKDRMYNGFPRAWDSQGSGKMSIDRMKNGICARHSADIPRLKGVPYLEPGMPIYPEDLDAWEKFARSRCRPRRTFIRTGRWARRAAKGRGRRPIT